MNISFGWTWPALVAGHKTVTRRNWKPIHAAKFKAGKICAALDKDTRYGGVQIGKIRLVITPYLDWIANMPDSDYAAEGLEWLDQHPQCIPKNCHIDFQTWRKSEVELYVVRFEPLEFTHEAEARLKALMQSMADDIGN